MTVKNGARFRNENRDRPSLKLTLMRETLEALDAQAGPGGRSFFVERVLRKVLAVKVHGPPTSIGE